MQVHFEGMLYLIGGPPRCGKTTLSAALAKKLQIPYLSIDHIASVIPPYIAPERRDASFPLRSLRQKVNNDNDRFFEVYKPEEIVAVYREQAATCWPGVRSFINYAINDEHTLILEGWQLLPRFLAEIPLENRSLNVRACFLFKRSVEDIVAGLKMNDPVNDWVLRHTKQEASFARIAAMISCFGYAIEREAAELGFHTVDMDHNFTDKIADLTESLAK